MALNLLTMKGRMGIAISEKSESLTSIRNITARVVTNTKIVLKRFMSPGPKKFLIASRSLVISAIMLPVRVFMKNDESRF